MGCIECNRGFHAECISKCKKCHPEEVESSALVVIEGKTDTTSIKGPVKNLHGGVFQDLKDPYSTGRKRAAKLYPLDKEQPCEWQGKKNCGGGRYPVTGCISNTQVARHHGPVKNTTRNHAGNVHLICTRCHNHWHELNDIPYVESEYALLPHDPMDATVEELTLDEVAWVTGEIGKKFTLASSVNKLDKTS